MIFKTALWRKAGRCFIEVKHDIIEDTWDKHTNAGNLFKEFPAHDKGTVHPYLLSFFLDFITSSTFGKVKFLRFSDSG